MHSLRPRPFDAHARAPVPAPSVLHVEPWCECGHSVPARRRGAPAAGTQPDIWACPSRVNERWTLPSRQVCWSREEGVTLSLDEDIIEAFRARSSRSLPAAVSEAPHEPIAGDAQADDAHRVLCLSGWTNPAPSMARPAPEETAAAGALLSAVARGKLVEEDSAGQMADSA